MKITGWHFSNSARMSHDSRLLEPGKTYPAMIHKKGVWVKAKKSEVGMCGTGMHASRKAISAYNHFSGDTISIVTVNDVVEEFTEEDHSVASAKLVGLSRTHHVVHRIGGVDSIQLNYIYLKWRRNNFKRSYANQFDSYCRRIIAEAMRIRQKVSKENDASAKQYARAVKLVTPTKKPAKKKVVAKK